MMSPAEPTLQERFFGPVESVVGSFAEIEEKLEEVFTRRIDPVIGGPRTFAWRGVIDATWGLHSSLYRSEVDRRRSSAKLDEYKIRAAERDVLIRAHRWGLHNGDRGRLSILEQLATLQHFGAPTRLVDVSLNAYIGLWFAVERDNANSAEEPVDGRLFAIDVTDRLINEIPRLRPWEDDLEAPWSCGRGLTQDDWCASTWAWEPPPFEARIASQRGAFLFGGVPKSNVGITWSRDQWTAWKIDEVRACTCLPLVFHKFDAEGKAGRPSTQPSFTFRIAAAAKAEIRRRLDLVFGYDYKTLFRDYPGFATFGLRR
jgi:FRG domain